MKLLAYAGIILLMFITMQATVTIYDFKEQEEVDAWSIVNDVVMGGRSDASLELDEDGHGVFSGAVSLENNGGFASMRLRLSPMDLRRFKTIHLRVKGEPTRYQFRCKSSWNEPQSYVAPFETTGQWQEVALNLREMVPTFRGNRLDMPDFPGESLAEIAILIGNKKAESFALKLDRIWLE
ncbi:CIA30 family protein [Robertkochia marina]|uniref:CIA30 family protein n=1 Tax=Robertkochia marina TaxID=1227945 RepID=A0A4S3M2F0_9FLAO|nr:CIA30 family protein [Robertkochia marina]THD69236.1 CIA30 family protein [Robertkochia marina]TRZ47505.1 CIA30 family protein [Robertkochia marina]